MNIISKHLSDRNDQEDFSRWAFGTVFNENDSYLNEMFYWNLYHGDKLELHPDGALEDDIPKMIEIWQKTNRKSCPIYMICWSMCSIFIFL